MSIKDFAAEFVKAEDAAFQQGDFAALSKIEDANVVYHMGMPLGDFVGQEAHKNDIIGSRQACSDLKQEWRYLAGDGNLFAMGYKASGRFTGEKPGFPTPIGKSFATDYLFLLRVENQKIVEVWAHGTMALT